MKKLLILPLALMLFAGFAGCKNEEQEAKNKELEELRAIAEMDRKEMENQYEQSAMQYDELKKVIQDDSLLLQLEAEQQRAEQLLDELRRVKKSDAAEILRLKKELESVRAVLQTYIKEVDRLTQENGRLTTERDEARAQLGDANNQISNLSEERNRLNDKVAIAAQLNASAISVSSLKKTGKAAKKIKDIQRFDVAFTISRNVTAAAGERNVYVRLMTPSGSVLNPSGKFHYENKSVEYSAVKKVEYTGEEQRITLVVNADNAFLAPGRYSAHIFCDDQMIGSTNFHLEK